jgi:hypothetical protein
MRSDWSDFRTAFLPAGTLRTPATIASTNKSGHMLRLEEAKFDMEIPLSGQPSSDVTRLPGKLFRRLAK